MFIALLFVKHGYTHCHNMLPRDSIWGENVVELFSYLSLEAGRKHMSSYTQGVEADRNAKCERISIVIARQPRDQAGNLWLPRMGSFLATLWVSYFTDTCIFCFFPLEFKKCLVVPCPCFFLWSGTNLFLDVDDLVMNLLDDNHISQRSWCSWLSFILV